MATTQSESAQDLRKRAKELFQEIEVLIAKSTPPDEITRLLNELQAHQIELEMQNKEMHRSQVDLESARERYFELYDLAPIGYLTISEKGLIQQANLAAATMLGVTRNFLLNKLISRFVFPEDQDIYFHHIKRHIESGELQNWEMRLERFDGTHFLAELQSTLAHNDEIWITLHYITERKQMAAAIQSTIVIQDALEYAENIVETVREPLLVLDSGLKILSANSSFYTTFKVTLEETIGNFIYDLGNRQWDIPKLRLLLEEILPTNSVFNDYEVDHIFQRIGHKTILLNARQIFRKDIGQHVILLAMEDITERKLLEVKIQSVLKYAENIVETVRGPLVVLDSNLKILFVNGNFYDTFKVTPKDTIGNFIYDLGNRQWDIPKLRLLLEEILPTNSVFNDYEVDHIFQSIGHKTILLNARQIFRKDIGQHVILLAMDDITERKHKNLALEERKKELSCLYSIISLCNLPGIALDELFMKAVMRIPPAWQFPEITEASIEIDGKSFQTTRFRETPWMLVSEIYVYGTLIGQLKVCYLEERWASDEGPFFIQERHLLNAIANNLSLFMERKKTELNLKAVNKMLQTVIDTIPSRISWKDEELFFLGCNLAFARDAGVASPHDLIGKDDFQILCKGQAEAYRADDRSVMESGTARLAYEESQTTVDDDMIWLRTSKVPLRNETGAIIGVLGIYEDITC